MDVDVAEQISQLWQQGNDLATRVALLELQAKTIFWLVGAVVAGAAGWIWYRNRS